LHSHAVQVAALAQMLLIGRHQTPLPDWRDQPADFLRELRAAVAAAPPLYNAVTRRMEPVLHMARVKAMLAQDMRHAPGSLHAYASVPEDLESCACVVV